MINKQPSTVSKILFLQLLVALLVGVLFAIMEDWLAAFYAFWGGAIGFIPNLYLALKIKTVQGQEAKIIVRTFYAGESGKLLLTAFLFIITFHQLPNIKLLPLMTGYVSVLSIFWFALILRE
ncbi:MAG: F0F1 ATP synthase assembly protein I [Methylococcaceae bacterium]|nr:F0F1 ATP synthase assembly protein I [Methylococcaceae bacterium]